MFRFADKLEREMERTKELCGKLADQEIERLKQIQHFEVTRLRERLVGIALFSNILCLYCVFYFCHLWLVY